MGAQFNLSPDEVRRQLKSFRRCVDELHAGLAPFGPRRLAKRLLQAIDVLEHALLVLTEAARTEADPESEILLHSSAIGVQAAKLYGKYLEYLLHPSQTAYPMELLMPLRELLSKYGHSSAEQFTFCVTQKWQFNNEISLLKDPLERVVEELTNYDPRTVLPTDREESEKDPQFVVAISYPMAEGRKALLHPMLLHEVAHAINVQIKLNKGILPHLEAELDKSFAARPADDAKGREHETCHRILNLWVVELCADLIPTYYFGPSLLCAMRLASGMLGHLDRAGETHPDTRLRLVCMLTLLKRTGCFGGVDGVASSEADRVGEIMWKWLHDAETLDRAPDAASEHVKLVRGLIWTNRDRIINHVIAKLDGQAYVFADRFDAQVQRLRNGIPPDETDGVPSSVADILNSGWAVALLYPDRPFSCLKPDGSTQLDYCFDSLNELLLKAIENSYLLAKAKEKDLGPLIAEDPDTIPPFAGLGNKGSLDPPELIAAGEVIITPVLSRGQVGDAAINLRLGAHFLVPKASDLPVFDASSLDRGEIRKTQDYMNKSIGQDVVLHPGRLILGQTLEYISFPPDVAGMVLSRSRYGRLGLVVATATFVHPGWKGCLTLELAHYGDVPIRLKCGSQIAQLVLFDCSGVPPTETCPSDRPPFPTRPELTEMTRGPDQDFLAFLGDQLKEA